MIFPSSLAFHFQPKGFSLYRCFPLGNIKPPFSLYPISLWFWIHDWVSVLRFSVWWSQLHFAVLNYVSEDEFHRNSVRFWILCIRFRLSFLIFDFDCCGELWISFSHRRHWLRSLNLIVFWYLIDDICLTISRTSIFVTLIDAFTCHMYISPWWAFFLFSVSSAFHFWILRDVFLLFYTVTLCAWSFLSLLWKRFCVLFLQCGFVHLRFFFALFSFQIVFSPFSKSLFSHSATSHFPSSLHLSVRSLNVTRFALCFPVIVAVCSCDCVLIIFYCFCCCCCCCFHIVFYLFFLFFLNKREWANNDYDFLNTSPVGLDEVLGLSAGNQYQIFVFFLVFSISNFI